MSTTALYTFIDNNDMFCVYKHYDGYPRGALKSILKAQEYSWKLPRFESNDFSASFIAANKDKRGGNIVIVNSPDAFYHTDYRYDIMEKEGQIYINAFSCRIDLDMNKDNKNKYDSDFDDFIFIKDCIFEGSLEEFEKFCKSYDNK